MPNSHLTLEYVIDEVRTNLGSSGIEVEVEESDIQKGLIQALRAFNRNTPRRTKTKIAVTQAQKKYAITHPGLLGITHVEFVDPIVADKGTLDPFDPYSVIHDTGLLTGGETVGQYDQALQYQEQFRNVTSAENEWFVQWEDEQYYLYIDIRRHMYCSYTYTWKVTPDDSPATGLRHVGEGEIGWICDYTTARAKLILYRIRGKFQGITGPDGGEQPIDWSELRDEGREDTKDLTEEIEKRRRPLEPLLG